MKIRNGETSLELEQRKNSLEVTLESSQVKAKALKELPQDVIVSQEDERTLLTYPVSVSAQSLATAIRKSKSRLEKLKLAQKLSSLDYLSGQFQVPFMHPENIVMEGDRPRIVHFGIRGLLAPQELSDEDFLTAYKALVSFIFNSRVSFESILTGATSLRDKFSQAIVAAEGVEAVNQLIQQEFQKETEKVNESLAQVPKGRYRFFKYFGFLVLAAVLVLGFFTFSFYTSNQKQAAVITAHTDFLTQNYAQTQTDLQSYVPAQLPKSARYILAVSSVNLSNLTVTQKQSVLNNISTKSDDNTLNYWVYSGRGDFNQALNLAQNLGDDQLTLLAYTNLYEATKLNSTMNGAEKQKLLDDYNKKISDLTKSIGK